MKTTDIIKKYEMVKVASLKDIKALLPKDAIMMAREDIAKYCGVKIKTVRNWRTGISPGKQASMLLQRFAAEHRLGDNA